MVRKSSVVDLITKFCPANTLCVMVPPGATVPIKCSSSGEARNRSLYSLLLGFSKVR